MTNSNDTTKTSKSLSDGTGNSTASITIHGVDSPTVTYVLGKLAILSALAGVTVTVVIMSAVYLSLSWQRETDRAIEEKRRESDRQHTLNQLTNLRINELATVLAREGILKPGDWWDGPIKNIKPKGKDE